MIRMSLAACTALAALSLAPAALAGDGVTVKLRQPLSEPVRLIAGGAMFLCADDACAAPGASSETYAPSTCKTLAAKVGPVTAFSAGAKSFTPERLVSCNGAAAARATGSQTLAAN